MEPKIYFSQFFGVDSKTVNDYGAFDVSLVNDLPLFVDPFLLFNSQNATYQTLHADVLKYMLFLKEQAVSGNLSDELIALWFSFKEVKQNWLGFSRSGNEGRGLGPEFASSLCRNFASVFQDFGTETLTASSHLEKLCLIRGGVGRDAISDFTTNLIKGYLADYTQSFAKQHLLPKHVRTMPVAKVRFNYDTRSWVTEQYELPYFRGDYVLLTPRDILTKDESWINRPELIGKVHAITDALPDGMLRAQINQYMLKAIPIGENVSKKQRDKAYEEVLEKFPALLDYYILEKERDSSKATSIAAKKVDHVQKLLVDQIRQFVIDILAPSGFYESQASTKSEAMQRLGFLKDVIENKGGHRLFYVEGKPVQREADLQLLYRLTWYATVSDVGREANDGRGPVDYKISRGAKDKVLVEFKLASNTQLERNLTKQTAVYEKASDATHSSIKAILFFSLSELNRVKRILIKTKLDQDPDVVLIDARDDNKPSGSKA